MNLKRIIKDCIVLNVDEQESKISPYHIVMEEHNVNDQSYIISDADEELLILIEFTKITHLKNIKIYCLPQTESADDDINTAISAPKEIDIFKLQNLNINFDDIRSMKAHKTIKCSINKLIKGQNINLHKNSKTAVKFQNIQYLAIYIKSNQNDTEQTYLNGIAFYGPEIYKISKNDENDKENTKHLKDLVASFNEASQGNQGSSKTQMESSYLLQASNVYDITSTNCILKQCSHLVAICDALKRYNLYIQRKQMISSANNNAEGNEDEAKSDEKMEHNDDNNLNSTIQILINEGFSKTEAELALNLSDERETEIDSINNIEVLNGFNHLLFQHGDDFEDIYNILIEKGYDGQICDLRSCLLLKRNQRNRSEITRNESLLKKLYFDGDNMNVMQQQLLDRIHCHYLHSFDIGYKMTRKEKHNIIQKPNCLKLHGLTRFSAYNDAFKCDDCDKKMIEGDEMWGCRRCNYDLCHSCYHKDDDYNQDNDGKKEDHSVNDMLHDKDVLKISELIKTKRSLIRNINGLERINTKNNKYISGDKQNEWNLYDYGFRFFYWSHYKNNRERIDDVHHMKESDYHDHQNNQVIAFKHYGASNEDSRTSGDFYIEHKYTTFKAEMLFNQICVIGEAQWNNYIQKANVHIETNHVRSIYCPRKQSATYYVMKYGQGMSVCHLVAMMIYCSNDQLQFKFSQTFRKLNQTETNNEMKERHRNYYWLGRLLRENVEAFGMRKPFKSYIGLYRGVTKHFTFSSMLAYIRGPFSTTTDYSVAANFSENIGMILEIVINANRWNFNTNEGKDTFFRITCFEACWISDFSNEQEIFCIGGLYPFYIQTIIEPNGINWKKYIKGLKQLTFNMHQGMEGHDLSTQPASTQEEQQIVFRLLSHELYRYYPNHEKAHEFKGCPKYIKHILHLHCTHIKTVIFKEIENKVIDWFFKYDNEWIKLKLLMTIFPNVKGIHYSAFKKDASFITESSILESVLLFIHQNKNSLKQIQIRMKSNCKDPISKHIEKYENDFQKLSWKIHLIDFDVGAWNLKQVKSLGLTEKQIKEFWTEQYGSTKQVYLEMQLQP